MTKTFQVGDKVLYEVGATQDAKDFAHVHPTRPRWNHGSPNWPQDYGYSNVWEEAEVTEVQWIDGEQYVRIRNPNWPHLGFDWGFPKGCEQELRLVGRVEAAKPVDDNPKNNDGRETCAWCGAATRVCGSLGCGPHWEWRVCTVCGK